jgi:ribonuclease E
MEKKILINALHPEEKRVAIVEGDTLIDFYVEVASKEHLKGNIYKGTIARIEPGLQAAFVDFGQKKQGFLQMREISPDFFQNKKDTKRARIQDVLTKGQEVIVQVEKDERDSKGASLTTYISIPGRYIVMMPGQTRVGISRKIEDREDRDRLKELFSKLKLPKDMGFILRTVCSEISGEELSNDLKYLVKLWNKIQAESKKAATPALIYKEQDIAVRTVRDYLTADVSEVQVDDEAAYKKIKEFLRKTLPWCKININYYREKGPIFSRHAIEEQIAGLSDRFVKLPSHGYIVFDKTEALTAIDVNSGRSRKEENVEATALKTNLEAVDEIARQLRLRDIGGLVVMDFIDMDAAKHRRDVETRLKDALASDKAHMDTTGISRFGIVEMTRERMRPTFVDTMNTPCQFCGGAGILKSSEAVAISALRDIHAKASSGTAKIIQCKLPVESANYLMNSKRDDIMRLEKVFGINILVTGDLKLLPGQFSVETDAPKEARKEAPKENRREPQKEPRKDKRKAPVQEPAGEAALETAAETTEAQVESGSAGPLALDRKKKSQRNRQRNRRRRKKSGKGERQTAAATDNPSSVNTLLEGRAEGQAETTPSVQDNSHHDTQAETRQEDQATTPEHS